LRRLRQPRRSALQDLSRPDVQTPVNFQSGHDLTGVEIVLTSRLGQIHGSVTDARQQILTDYSVVLFRDDRASSRRLARWIRPDANGDFSIAEVLPGCYLIVAVDDVDDGEWLNADYLERFRSRATRVEIAAGEQMNIVLTKLRLKPDE
jgi:hypothetical protein